jgi:predicted RNase H-like HicB family nuclease
MSRYVALIHRGETGSWGISFPDFPGCISAADRSSFPDIVARGAEALRFHVEGLREVGAAIPEPRTIEDLRADLEFADDFADAIVTLVPLLPPRAKPLRINISIDSNLLLEIDAKAEQLGMNRSEFLAEAARSYLTGGTPTADVVSAWKKSVEDLKRISPILPALAPRVEQPLTTAMNMVLALEGLGEEERRTVLSRLLSGSAPMEPDPVATLRFLAAQSAVHQLAQTSDVEEAMIGGRKKVPRRKHR